MPKIHPDKTDVETFAVKIDKEPVLANQKRSKVSMLASDAFLLIIEHIQVINSCVKIYVCDLLSWNKSFNNSFINFIL